MATAQDRPVKHHELNEIMLDMKLELKEDLRKIDEKIDKDGEKLDTLMVGSDDQQRMLKEILHKLGD